jgi:hypothetical protein
VVNAVKREARKESGLVDTLEIDRKTDVTADIQIYLENATTLVQIVIRDAHL